MPRVESRLTAWKSPRGFALDMLRACLKAGLSLKSSLLLVAHMSLSTGWGRAVHNFNFCGIKARETEPYALLEGFEYKNGVRQPKVAMRWRVFDSLEAGVRGVLAVLHAPRYQRSLASLLEGAEAYWKQLGEDGWYTAPMTSTAAQMKARWKQIVAWAQLDRELAARGREEEIWMGGVA